MPVGKTAIRIFSLALILSVLSPSLSLAQQVRVQLLDRTEPSQIVIESGSALIFSAHLGDPNRITVPANRPTTVRYAIDDDAIWVGGEGIESMIFPDSLLIGSDVTNAQATVSVRSRSGTIRREYDASFRIYVDDVSRILQLVNYADIDSYVAAVIDREYGLGDVEGTKAMAIVARTYAIRAMRERGRFDVYDDTRSQVYHGIEQVTAESSKAVRETRDVVLTHNGVPIEAVYHASSGGHTADNDRVWASQPVAYLRATPDPYDASEHVNWVTVVSADGLLETVSQKYDADIVGVEAGNIDPSGRLETVSLETKNGDTFSVPANTFRLAVINRFRARTLRSLRFDIERRRDVYRFNGSGYGHGVGLSQWGAHGMANSGYSFEEILAHYYESAELSVLSDDGRGILKSHARPLIRRTSSPGRASDPDQADKKRIGW